MTQILETERRRSLSAREIANRNRESCGTTLSNVMKTAATACELAHGKAAQRAARTDS